MTTKIITARQAKLNYFAKEVAEISQDITNAIMADSPTKKEVSVTVGYAMNIVNHVANLYRNVGYNVFMYDNHNGTIDMRVSWL